MKKSQSMSLGGRFSTDRRSRTIQDFGLVRSKPSIASASRLSGEFNQFVGTTSVGHRLTSGSTKNATWEEPDLLNKQAQRNQVAFNQVPKNRDAFAYYSCPDVRVAAILQTRKKMEGRSDLSKMMGLRRPMRRNSLQSNTASSSTLTTIQDDSSVSTRRSRVSVEMHDSVIHEHLEEMLDDVDSDESISEEDDQEREAIADVKKIRTTQTSSANIIGREFVLTNQSSIESTAAVSLDEATAEESIEG